MKALVTHSCPTLCDPMDCSPPGFSVHGILQARVLEWAVIPLSKGSSQLRFEPRSPALQADSLPLSHQGSPLKQQVVGNSPVALLLGKAGLESIAGAQWGPLVVSYLELGDG